MNDIEELEKLVTEEAPEPPPSRSELTRAKIAYHAAVVLIDLVTAYTVGMLTFWYYGVIWFIGNAVVFFLHHGNWERPESNDNQSKTSIVGMIVAVSSMFVLAIFSGAMALVGNTKTWVQLTIEIFSVVVFFFHAVSFAVYYFQDDEWKINRQIAKAKANARKKVQIAKAAGKVIEANKDALRERNTQYGKHGQKVVDAALAKVENRQIQPSHQFGSETKTPENPTKGGSGN